jgi:hypothetical protein
MGVKTLADEGLQAQAMMKRLDFEMHAKEFHDIDGGAG